MKKRRKLIRYPLLCAVLLLTLWLLDGKPVFTAQRDLNRLERASLAEESRLLDTRFVIFASCNSSPQYEEYLAAGVTETHLHLARLWKRGLFVVPAAGPVCRTGVCVSIGGSHRGRGSRSYRRASVFLLYRPACGPISGAADGGGGDGDGLRLLRGRGLYAVRL